MNLVFSQLSEPLQVYNFSIITPADPTSQLKVRLRGGHAAHEGRVEIYHGGEWGTICDSSFGYNDAKVICTMMGYQWYVQ